MYGSAWLKNVLPSLQRIGHRLGLILHRINNNL